MTEAESPLSAAEASLVAGRWSEARDRFQAVLADAESGAALFGLGLALWWLRQPQEAIRLQERAFQAFRRGGDHEGAFLAAMYLCLGYNMTFGNNSAARGWLAKAAGVVQEHGLDALDGWVLLCRAVIEHDDDPAASEPFARRALEAAAATGDTDLDVCARSQLGAAMVEMGRLAEGAALLDEAMAGALGSGVETLDSVVLASCRTIISCSRAADIKRATQWIRAASDFNERYGSPHLYTTCRVHLAAVHYLTGAWAQAESELDDVLRLGGLVEPELHAEAVAMLGTLRLAQGRVDEAERLIAGHEQHSAVAIVLARIRAKQDRLDVALWLVQQRLRVVRPDSLAAAKILAVLVELEIANGEVAAALTNAQRLTTLAHRTDVPLLHGVSHHILGSALAASGDDAAGEELERARSLFVELGMPYDAARSRLAMARFVQRSNPTGAVEEAKGALATFDDLGAVPDADATLALLRTLGVKAVRRGPNAVGTLTQREREILALLGEGLSNREIAARLFITPKTVEHHVGHVLTKLDLRRRSEAVAYAVRMGAAT